MTFNNSLNITRFVIAPDYANDISRTFFTVTQLLLNCIEAYNVIVALYCVLRGGCKEHFYWWWIRPAVSASATSRGKVLGRGQQIEFLLQLLCGRHQDNNLDNDRKLRLAVAIRGRRRYSSRFVPHTLHLCSYRGENQISLSRDSFSRPNCKRKKKYNLKENTAFAHVTYKGLFHLVATLFILNLTYY